MKQCPNCGAELTDSVRFCPDCGAQMPTAPVAPVPPVPPVEQRETEAAAVSETEVAETQQPTTPEMQQPDASAVPPVYQPPQPWDASSAYQAPESFETPKKKRSALPFILGAIALLLVAGVLLFLFVDWKKPESDPKAHIERAYDKSEAAFSALFDNCTAQKAFVEALNAASEADALSIRMDVSTPNVLNVSMDCTISSDLSGGKLVFSFLKPEDASAKPLSVHAWVQEEALIFQVPDLDDAAFSIPLDAEMLMSELATSPLLDNETRAQISQALGMMDFSALAGVPFDIERLTELVNTLAETKEYVFLGKNPLSIAGTQRECWIYGLQLDEAVLTEIMSLYTDYISGNLNSMPADENPFDDFGYPEKLDALRVIVDERDYLVGVEIDIIIEGELQTLYITCNGAENPYEQLLMTFSEEPETVVTLNFKPSDDGILIEYILPEFGTLSVETDSKTLSFSIIGVDDTLGIELAYGVKDGSAYIEFPENIAPITITIGAASEPFKPFDGEADSLFSMVQEELMQYVTRISLKLYLDEGYYWLMEPMQ